MPAKEKIIKLWSPHDNQKKIIASQARFKVLRCGRRFGKTVYAVKTLVKNALTFVPQRMMFEKEEDYAARLLRKPGGGLFWYIAPTYKQAKMIAWRMLMDAVADLPKELVKKVNESELYIVLGNGNEIHIKGADNPDSLRGIGLHGVVLDEYAFMKPMVWEEIISAMLTDTQGWAVFISTPNGFNHFYNLYMQAKGLKDWETFHFTSYDNPHVKAEEIDMQRERISEEKFVQEYLAEFRKREGLVYKEFDRDRHVYTELPTNFERDQVIAGIDFGFNNPAAIVVIIKDKEGNFWIEDEYYKSGKTNTELVEVARSLQQLYNINIVYPDPAEPDRIKELREAGLNCRDVVKVGARGQSLIVKGIDQIQELFKANRLKINKSCTHLLYELETYVYPDEEKHGVKEVPIKENDHALDALRYALFTNTPTPVPFADFGLYAKDFS